MTDAAPFTPEVFEFLRQLKRRNNREWFTRNKPRYEAAIRNPALLFIAAVTPRLAKLSRKLPAQALRGSAFRIYRDIRFSSDKRPYKTHLGMQWTYAKSKDAHSPCYYLHLEPDGCFVAAGIWHPDNVSLNRIRQAIVANPPAWKKIRRGLELGGDRLARPPRGFDPAHPLIEDLKYKDYIAAVDLSERQICRAKFIPDFLDACRTMTPLVEFTWTALAPKARAAEVTL
jgi:uncharacterized protein (TIGR02453 family)